MTKTTNPLIADVFETFDHLDRHGVRHKLSSTGFHPVRRWLNHIQGFARYGDFLIMSSNAPWLINPAGVLVVFDKDEKKVVHVVELTQYPTYVHAGGMQVIGDFLVVGLETKDTDDSYVIFYDLSPLASGDPPTERKKLALARPGVGTGAVGMTSWLNDGKKTYVVAAYNDGACDFYTAEADFFGGGSPLQPVGDGPSTLADNGYSSINLLTDTDQRKWLVGFRQDDDRRDFADLYRFSIFDHPPPPNMSPVTDGTRHFYYDAGACRYVGFRYGAGLSINGENKDFAFYATDRNPRFAHINYNRFDPPAPR